MYAVANNFTPDKQNSTIKAACFQIQVDGDDFTKNEEKILRLIETSSADLLVFPEACTSGFQYNRLREIAEFNDLFLEKAKSISAKLKKQLYLPLLCRDNESYFNRTFFISDGMVRCNYDKIHLIGALKEDEHLRPGKNPVSFTVREGITAGASTCYDLRFPEIFRYLTLRRGIHIILCSCMWPVERKEHLRILAQARAVENQCPVLLTNAVGPSGKINNCGQSAIYNARGESLALAGINEEETLTGEIHLDEILDWRSRFPVLADASDLIS